MSDETALRETIDDYFLGLYHSDAERLGRAFHLRRGKGDRSIFAPHKPVALGASDRVSAAGTAVTVNNRETPRRRSWCDAKIDLSPFWTFVRI
jgi:hypothetical protein